MPTDGAFNRRAWEIAVLVHLRDRLASGAIWVDGSRTYRTLDDYFLPTPAFATMRAEGQLGLAVSVSVSSSPRNTSGPRPSMLRVSFCPQPEPTHSAALYVSFRTRRMRWWYSLATKTTYRPSRASGFMCSA